MRLAVLLFLGAATLRFDVTDARGKRPSGVTIETGEADGDGWCQLKTATKGKGSPVLVWPFDGRAKLPDGPGEIPAIVIESGDPKALGNPRVVAALAAGELLGISHETGLDPAAPAKAVTALSTADEPFAKGVGLLCAKNPGEAADLLARALRERERQLTRVPSEIYPAALLCGKALLESGKFDEAALAFLKALRQRPSDPVARRFRSEALAKAGKPDAQ
ncbi:MAG: tetratricopeptide repeat protein [Acidobacteriota bacterium]